jgi:CBS domain-containing protein/nucleotide-binding universal stress UspA family protein
MFKRILVAYDGSEGAEGALVFAIALARAVDAELSSVSVEEHLPRYAASVSEVEGAKEQIDEHFRGLTKHARDVARLEGLELEAIVRQGHEVEEILDVARSERADLLVLGSHGHSRVFERFIGSTSLATSRLAPCSTMIVRATGPAADLTGLSTIVVGLDGSPLGRLAFREALDLALLAGASVVGVTVREASPLLRQEPADHARVGQLKAAAAEQAAAAGVPFEHLARAGHAAMVLRDVARQANAGLLVLGATGLEHPWSPTIGGTAGRVASEAHCSVLLVRFPQGALHVRDIMTPSPSSVAADTPLAAVVELLLRRNVKAVPVVNAERHVVGIVTGGDLLSRGDLKLRVGIKQELDAETLRGYLQTLARGDKTAGDIMSRHVRTIEADETLAGAVARMAEHRVKRLPVVDENDRLIGIVSRADVLRAIAALPEPVSPPESQPGGAARTVGDAVIVDVPTVAPETPAEQVLAKVVQNPLRRVVVKDPDGRVLGLVGDRDLLARSSADRRSWIARVLHGPARRRAAEPRPPRGESGLTAADLMTRSPITVRPDDTLAHAVRLMMQHQVKRLIVVDDSGRLLGLVDRREVLRLLAGDVVANRP